MVEELKTHLQGRPFAHVFNNLRNHEDRNDVISLLIMCILDFHVEERNLYTRITETQRPKLLLELMGFRSFKSFYYFEYQGHGQLESKYLKCKFCELIGPYVLILTHMTINHDEHIGLVKCAYCNQTDLKKHFEDGTMQECYDRYVQKPDVADAISDTSTIIIIEIVTEFFGILKNLSIDLGVHTRRILHNFTGSGYGTLEQLFGRNNRSPSFKVNYRQRKTRKPILTETLNSLANHIWMQFYGRPLPIQSTAQEQSDHGRSTRSNNSTPRAQNASFVSSSRGGTSSSSSPTFSTISAHSSDTGKSAESKFGDYVAHRLELQPELVKRRRLEAAIQQTISTFEIENLENP